jgi:hypothetical protein
MKGTKLKLVNKYSLVLGLDGNGEVKKYLDSRASVADGLLYGSKASKSSNKL